jgi:LexA DNA binding domain
MASLAADRSQERHSPRVSVKQIPTVRQGQYLAFISQYMRLTGAAPSEGDLAHYFRVSPPSAHQMCVTLERKGWLHRLPGVARSARLNVSAVELPTLGSSPAHVPRDLPSALVGFAAFVALRLLTSQHAGFAKFAAIHLIAERLEAMLEEAGVSPRLITNARNSLFRIAPLGFKSTARSRPEAKRRAQRKRDDLPETSKLELTSQLALFPPSKEKP